MNKSDYSGFNWLFDALSTRCLTTCCLRFVLSRIEETMLRCDRIKYNRHQLQGCGGCISRNNHFKETADRFESRSY